MDQDTADSRALVSMATLFEGGLLLLALGLGWFLERGPLAQVEWTLSAAGYGLAAAAPLLAGLLLMTRYPIGPLKELETVAQRMIVPLFVECKTWQLLAISLMAGAGEEALFRGVIQAGVSQWTGSSAWALATASVLFGLAHPITPTYAVLAGLIGAYLGWLLLATDNLLVPIVTHAAYDFFALLYLVRREAPQPAAALAESPDDLQAL